MKRKLGHLVFNLLFIVILLGGAYLRFTGLLWGEYQYLHPDERFLIWVGSHVKSVEKTIRSVIDRHLPDSTAGTEQFTVAEDRLRAEYSDIPNVLVRSVKQEPVE